MLKAQALARKVVRSVCPLVYRELARDRQRKKLESLLRSDDVMFVGHPKSGNTWLAYMLAVLKNADTPRVVTTANVGDFIPIIHANDVRIAEYPDLPAPRIFRNEGPQFPESYPRTLYIVRDPRAVLVSYYHHCKHDTREADWQLDEFVGEMLEHGCIRRLEPHLLRWDRQVLAWHKRQQSQKVHIVRYEDLKADCFGELGKVAEFIGLRTDPAALEIAVARGSFSSMRNQEKIYGAESFPGEKGNRGFFMRKGEVEGWRDELSDRNLATIETAFSQAMRVMGYEPAS
jgi:hypothetical protein